MKCEFEEQVSVINNNFECVSCFVLMMFVF